MIDHLVHTKIKQLAENKKAGYTRENVSENESTELLAGDREKGEHTPTKNECKNSSQFSLPVLGRRCSGPDSVLYALVLGSLRQGGRVQYQQLVSGHVHHVV